MRLVASARDVLCWDCMAMVASLGWLEIGGLQWSSRAVDVGVWVVLGGGGLAVGTRRCWAEGVVAVSVGNG